jgi:hypothetical protein
MPLSKRVFFGEHKDKHEVRHSECFAGKCTLKMRARAASSGLDSTLKVMLTI